MAYYGDPPWHGLGTSIPERANTQQVISAAGLNWEVEMRPIPNVSALADKKARRCHFVRKPSTTVHLDDGGLVTIGIGIRAGATKRLGLVSGESLDMLGVGVVAKCMSDYVVAHHPMMPGTGKTAQAVHSARCLKDSLHALMMDNRLVSWQGIGC